MDELLTLGQRAKFVRKRAGKTQAEMAAFLQMAVGTWQKLERDEVIPSGETLIQFEKLGVNPGWVLSGLGPRNKEEQPSEETTGVDVVILARLGEVVRTVYFQAKRTPPERGVLLDAGELYNQLLSKVRDITDEDMVDAAIGVLQKQFKERIEKSEPGSSKAVAS